jgi:hypothetical protein
MFISANSYNTGLMVLNLVRIQDFELVYIAGLSFKKTDLYINLSENRGKN